MIKAVRGRLASLGLDPRQYAILSYGGGGSLFTPEIARAIGAPRVLIPELASVLSAFGAATTDVRRERLRSVTSPMPVDPALMQRLMAELEAEVRADMTADGVADIDQAVEFEADLRFSKQIYELQMTITPGPFTDASSDALLASFMDEYAKRYGKGSIVLRTPVELVGLRAIGIGRTIRASVGTAARPAVETGTLAVPVGHPQGPPGPGRRRHRRGRRLRRRRPLPRARAQGCRTGRLHGHHGVGPRRQQRKDRRARHVHHGRRTMRTTTTEVSP